MVNLPANLPFYLKKQLSGVKSADELVDRLYPVNKELKKSDKTRNRHHFGSFLLIANEKWLIDNPSITKKLYERSFKVLNEAKKNKGHFIDLIKELKPKFDKVKGIKDLTFKIGDESFTGSSTSLTTQSRFFKLMLSNEAFAEGQAFLNNQQIDFETDYPEECKSLMKAQETLTPPKGLSFYQLEIILALAKRYELEDTLLPLLERSFLEDVTPDNAYYLYLLSSSNHMPDLQKKCLVEIEKFIDSETAFKILDTLKDKNDRASVDLFDSCLNILLDKLPKLLQTAGSELIKIAKGNELDNQTFSKEQRKALAKIKKILNYLPKISKLYATFLHQLDSGQLATFLDLLPKNRLNFLNLSKCNFKALPKLKDFTALEELILRKCKNLTNIFELKYLKKLHYLDLSKCSKLNNPAPLVGKKLKFLSIVGCSSIQNYKLQHTLNQLDFEGLSIYHDDKVEHIVKQARLEYEAREIVRQARLKQEVDSSEKPK